jgi:hypothetical protein
MTSSTHALPSREPLLLHGNDTSVPSMDSGNIDPKSAGGRGLVGSRRPTSSKRSGSPSKMPRCTITTINKSRPKRAQQAISSQS